MNRSRFQPHFVLLCEHLNMDKLLPYLRQERMVTNDEYETLTNPAYNPAQQRERLLIMLPRKGRNYFENFGKCLVWSGQVELARHIGVDVDNLPPAPFKPDPGVISGAQTDQDLLRAIKSLISSSSSNPGSTAEPVGAGYPAPYPPPRSDIYPSNPPYREVNPAPLSGTSTLTSRHDSHEQHSPARASGRAGVGGAPVRVGGTSAGVGGASDPMSQALERGGGASDPMSQALSQASDPLAQLLRSSRVEEGQPADRGSTEVFILYCKDTSLEDTYGCSGKDFCSYVLELADILTCSGGIACSADFYEDVAQPNWNKWTLDKIQRSKYVVMVCSPQLIRDLNSVDRSSVAMHKGMFFSDAVVNSIVAPKFVPVFLNKCEPRDLKKWMPFQLHTSRHFRLRSIRELHEYVDPQESTVEERNQRLSLSLAEPKYLELADLVLFLRGELRAVKPVQPPRPISIPQDHMYNSSHPVQAVPNAAEYIPDGDFVKIANRLPRDWDHLGVKLGVPYAEIDGLRRKHHPNHIPAVLEMFRIWRRSNGKAATKRVLKKALVDIGFTRLAMELFPHEKL